MKSKGAIAIGAAILLVQADFASASVTTGAVTWTDSEAGPDQETAPPQQGEIRRASPGTCALIGTIIGGVAGLIFGNRRNGGFNTGAALIGGAGAGLICHAVRWRSVHRNDQDEVNRRVAAITVDPGTAAQTYTSTVTGKTYTITAGETTYRPTTAEFTTITNVDAPQMGAKIIATPFRVTTAVLNLRASPGVEAASPVTGAFYQGDVIESLSETPDGQWVLVGYQNIGYGWVARRFLEPVSGPRDQLVFAVPGPPPVVAPPPRPVAQQRQRRRAVTPAPTMVLATSPARRISATPQTRTQTVQAQMVCRGITVSEGRRSDQHPSCTGSRGAILMG